MNIIVWGCRGTITSPGPSTIRYGGESTCIEVRSDEGEMIIIDAGSGIRILANIRTEEDRETFFEHLNTSFLQNIHCDIDIGDTTTSNNVA